VPVIAQINDIFNLTTLTAAPAASRMQKRIEDAFGSDGTDFWINFFACDKKHLDDAIIYLFTEHQLKLFYDWWQDKWKNQVFQKNLKFSIQNVFRALPDVNVNVKVKVKNRTRYFQILKGKTLFLGYKSEIKPFLFRIPPQNKQNGPIDFLDGKFEREPPDAQLGNNSTRDREIIMTILARSVKISKKFGGQREDEKCLYYLGEKIYLEGLLFTHKNFQYCIDIPCPCGW
jgi:hypothetical protein